MMYYSDVLNLKNSLNCTIDCFLDGLNGDVVICDNPAKDFLDTLQYMINNYRRDYFLK